MKEGLAGWFQFNPQLYQKSKDAWLLLTVADAVGYSDKYFQQLPFEFFIFISSEQCTHAVNFKKLNQYVQTLKKNHFPSPVSQVKGKIFNT